MTTTAPTVPGRSRRTGSARTGRRPRSASSRPPPTTPRRRCCPQTGDSTTSRTPIRPSPPRVITRFAVRADGTLGPAQDVAKAGPANYGITMSPGGGLLYVTSNVAQDVWGFRVGTDGSLTPVPGLPVSVRDPVGLKVTPDGQHLYVCANFDTSEPPGSGLLGFTIHADGSLTPTADSPARTEGTASVAITPDGRDIFANMQDASRVLAFAIETGGTLKLPPVSPFPTGGQRPLSQALDVRPVPATTQQ